MDNLTKEQRRKNMQNIRAVDTKPEIIVRSMLHRKGYRFRLHRKDLPGKPDLVFPGLKKIIEVRGCFWHMHNCKYGRVKPGTNIQYWREKRKRNVHRDKENIIKLRDMGWDVLILWECEIKDRERLDIKLQDFLSFKKELL